MRHRADDLHPAGHSKKNKKVENQLCRRKVASAAFQTAGLIRLRQTIQEAAPIVALAPQPLCGVGPLLQPVSVTRSIFRKTNRFSRTDPVCLGGRLQVSKSRSFLQRRRSYREQWPGPVRRHTFLAETCKLFRRFVRCLYLEPQLRRRTTNGLPASHERDRHFNLRVYRWRIPLFVY